MMVLLILVVVALLILIDRCHACRYRCEDHRHQNDENDDDYQNSHDDSGSSVRDSGDGLIYGQVGQGRHGGQRSRRIAGTGIMNVAVAHATVVGSQQKQTVSANSQKVPKVVPVDPTSRAPMSAKILP